MKAAVLYRSISGYTRTYAQWIAEELGAELYDCRKVPRRTLSGYDPVIFCGSLHLGGINGIDTIKRSFADLEGKRLIILVIGGSAARAGLGEEILTANFSEDQRMRMRLFYLRGGFDFGKLDTINKLLMLVRLWRLKKKPREDLTPDEKDLLAASVRPAYAMDKDNIRPLVEYARS